MTSFNSEKTTRKKRASSQTGSTDKSFQSPRNFSDEASDGCPTPRKTPGPIPSAQETPKAKSLQTSNDSPETELKIRKKKTHTGSGKHKKKSKARRYKSDRSSHISTPPGDPDNSTESSMASLDPSDSPPSSLSLTQCTESGTSILVSSPNSKRRSWTASESFLQDNQLDVKIKKIHLVRSTSEDILKVRKSEMEDLDRSPAPTSIGHRNLENTDEELEEPIEGVNIIIRHQEGKDVITSGTVSALIARLASREVQDKDFVSHFLLSHEYFVDPVTLLSQLIYRYKKFVIQSTDADTDSKKTLDYGLFIKLRVINVIRKWIEYRFIDMQNNAEWSQLLDDFILELESGSPNENSWSTLLKECKENYAELEKPEIPPSTKSRKRPESALDISPLELAKHLTTADFDIYRQIKIPEFYDQGWLSGNPAKSHNIVQLISRFNRISYWVAAEILSPHDYKKRAQVLSAFISVMKNFKTLRNFHGIMEVLSALNFTSIRRLEKTWKAVPNKLLAQFAEIESLMSGEHNFGNYRTELARSVQTSFPFLGLLLNDLVYIESHLDKTVQEDGQVNFLKISKIANIFDLVIKSQRHSFMFSTDENIQNYIKSFEVPNEKDLLEQSFSREPDNKNPKPKRLTSSLSPKDTLSKSIGILSFEDLDFKRKKKYEKTHHTRSKTLQSPRRLSKEVKGLPPTFEDIFKQDSYLKAFTAYCKKTHSEENLYFWMEVQKFKASWKDSEHQQAQIMGQKIFETFVSDTGDQCVSIAPEIKEKIGRAKKESNFLANVFEEAEGETELALKFTFSQWKNSSVF